MVDTSFSGDPGPGQADLGVSAKTPALSLILCSRNDNYMGDSRWRLQTALNFVAKNVEDIGRASDIEVVVSDWGSSAPLREVLDLCPAAARLTSFVHVPPALAAELQRDSPFAEVIALNAAARRSTGQFIGRIDQDTLVGTRFLRTFFACLDGTLPIPEPLMMGFSNVKYVNYRFTACCPSPSSVEYFVRWFGPWLKKENWRSKSPFYEAAVGIWLLRRDVWNECGGYDERMIYMNAMETNMSRRLLTKYPMVDLGEMCNYDFYHLEHYNPWSVRKTSTHRKVNPNLPFAEPDAINPNGATWGLSDTRLVVAPARRQDFGPGGRPGFPGFLMFAGRVTYILPTVLFDTLGLAARKWLLRSRRVRSIVHGRPVTDWPRLVLTRWKER